MGVASLVVVVAAVKKALEEGVVAELVIGPPRVAAAIFAAQISSCNNGMFPPLFKRQISVMLHWIFQSNIYLGGNPDGESTMGLVFE